jgi:hypothetical protein
MHDRLHRIIASVLLVITVPACTTWEVQHLSPEWVVTQYQPERVRVSAPTGYRIVIKHPVVSNDSIVSGDDSLSVALTEIQRIEVSRSDPAKTKLLALGIAGGLVLTGVIACVATNCLEFDMDLLQ